ncbi:MAG: hypothetical protein ACFCVA_11555, partial [Gammaproteobacteria bacterium]
GTDCRYPDHREVAQTAIHGDWVPAIPTGTTGLKELIGGKVASKEGELTVGEVLGCSGPEAITSAPPEKRSMP